MRFFCYKEMEPFDSFLIFISNFLGDHLYEGIFLAALIETIIPPIPTLAIFPTAGFLASQQGISLLGVIPMILLGAVGATIGTSVIYLIALKLGRTVLLRYLKNFRISEKKLEKVEKWFERYGVSNSPLGISLLQDIDSLILIDIDPPLPSLNESLRIMNQLRPIVNELR